MQDREIQDRNFTHSDKFSQQYEEFIAMTAHDLQSPLRKLAVLTDRLTSIYKEHPSKEVKEYTQRIMACVAEMQSLVDGFTELATAIPETIQYESCDLEEMLKKLLQEFSIQLKKKQAQVQLSNLPVTTADKSQLRLLFKKLLENILLFSRDEKPLLIDIRSEGLSDADKKLLELPEHKSYFKVTLTDNGMGFEPREAQRIFHPLVRLHGKASFPGSGLGLALVKKIADNHKGIIYAEGDPGNGARFILIIPENP